jgi:predicted ATP-dependent serine protease
MDEIICGVEVVLTGFVNNSEVLILGGAGIGKNLINLSSSRSSAPSFRMQIANCFF